MYSGLVETVDHSSIQARKQIKYRSIDRNQLGWIDIDLENLIPSDHAARAIWDLAGKFDLSAFEEKVKSEKGSVGRPCWPPQLLISVWVYGYTRGVGSARAIQRLMAHEPGMKWLSGNAQINYHTLADFRVGHKAALEHLFTRFLVLLNEEGIIDLKTVMHDGTKVQAVASRESYHRRKSLAAKLRAARKMMRQLDQEKNVGEARQEAARRRAAAERVERLQAAMEQMRKLEEEKGERKKEDIRVSSTEAAARKMKQPNGGWALSYNVQVSTEAQSRIIVGVGVTTAINDTQELTPALERLKEQCGQLPERIIADNGYATRQAVEDSRARQVELISPWKSDESREAGGCKTQGIAPEFAASRFSREGDVMTCPAGKHLYVIHQKKHHGIVKQIFEAEARDCVRCRWQKQCCGKRNGPRRIERPVETVAMREYLSRMKRRATKAIYKKRAEVAEFPNMWMKAMRGWRRFSVRGVIKAGMEAMWVAIAYNVEQWLRIRASRAS